MFSVLLNPPQPFSVHLREILIKKKKTRYFIDMYIREKTIYTVLLLPEPARYTQLFRFAGHLERRIQSRMYISFVMVCAMQSQRSNVQLKKTEFR